MRQPQVLLPGRQLALLRDADSLKYNTLKKKTLKKIFANDPAGVFPVLH